MAYNKLDFKKDIETVDISGFRIKSAIQAYLFIKQYKNKKETITISYRSYAPHGYYIDGISVDIYFNEVEDILKSYLEKYQVEKHYGNTTVQKSFVELDNIDYSMVCCH